MNEPCFYRVSVKAIAIDETGRFMLAREADGYWNLIGGGLEHGEDPRRDRLGCYLRLAITQIFHRYAAPQP